MSLIYKDFNYKGTVDTFADLPTENNEIKDVYTVTSENIDYIWCGVDWITQDNQVCLEYKIRKELSSAGGSGEGADLTEVNRRLTAIETSLASAVYFREKT